MRNGIYLYNGKMYLFESLCNLLGVKAYQRTRHTIQSKGIIKGNEIEYLGNAKLLNVFQTVKDGKVQCCGSTYDLAEKYCLTASAINNSYRKGFKLLGEYNVVFKRKGLFLDGIEVFPL